jgi:hypothetical protein
VGRPRKDLRGQRFGKLIILDRQGVRAKRNIVWWCQCDCGNKKEVMGANLYNGTTQSCGCIHTLPPGISTYNHLFRNYRDSARKRGFSFSLAKEEVYTLTQSDCVYCGSKPSQSHRLSPRKITNPEQRRYGTTYIYNGIDRKDNKQGYTPENSVPCCLICNRAKYTLSLEQFEQWITRMIAFRGGQK